MGVLDKVAFWKKGDDFGDLDKDFKDMPLGGDFGAPGSSAPAPLGQDPGLGAAPGADPFGAPAQPSFPSTPAMPPPSQPSFAQPEPMPAAAPPADANYMNEKNLEVISSKLDALRAAMESINQRLANIERLAGEEDTNQRRRYY